MVVASHGVESICQEKNGLSFVDLLRPFGEQTELNAPLRVSGTNVRITEAHLRFSYAHTMEQPTAELIDAHLKDAVEKISEEKLPAMPQKLSDGPEGLSSTPWFLKYRQRFLQLLCFDAHETFDHPLGCIYAVSSAEVDSLKAFEELIENTTLPSLMLQDYMVPMQDDECGKLFVIVHDGSREGQTGLEIAKEKVRIVQKEYGHDSCALLLVNTSGGKGELKGTPPVAFDALRPDAVRGGGAGEHEAPAIPPKDGLGSYLSKADLDRVNELVRNFLTRCFFPKLDVRIGRLRTCVAYKRRGLAGKLMDRTSSLLKTSFSNIGRETNVSIGFKHYTDESQMRQLGDILFLLGRYEDALDAFGAISVSKEAFPKFYAGVQFMIGLCYAMLVGFADPTMYFSKAYDYYLRTPGKTCRMFATRAAMLHSALCVTEGQPAQAAQVLLKGYDTEEMLRGALLLEQAAILLLKCQPPSLRKFAFQMTLAGVWFYNCMFHKLSLRCYNLILDIYTNRHWTKIEQHIAAMMLKFHLEQGNNSDAFSWTINMLTSQHQLAAEIQQEYMQWVYSYIKESPSPNVSSIADFNLPIVHLDTMEVKYDGEYVSGTAQTEETDPTIWRELEGRFRDPFSASTTTGFVVGANNTEEPYDLVVCGEPVRFSCVFENPLQTSIDVTSAQLLFEFERTDDSCSPTSSPVSTPEQSFSLRATAKAVMQLELIPRTPGRLRIIGISWFLNGVVPGHKLLGKVGWEEEGSRLPFRAKTHYPTLLFVALEPVPRLQLASAPVPVRLWKGELWRNTWDIESVGKVRFRNLQITSNTRDLTFALSNPSGSDDDSFFFKHGVYQMDCDSTDALQFDVCLNPQSSGRMALHTVIRYESPQSDTPLRVRFLRHTFLVDVVDSLHVQSWLLSSEISRTFLLAMELENRVLDSVLDVQSITAESERHQIQCPASEEGPLQLTVLPQQKLLRHVLVTESDAAEKSPLPNGNAAVAPDEDGSSVSGVEIANRAVVAVDDGHHPLAIAVKWTSCDRSNEISIVQQDLEDSGIMHRPRQGCLRFLHDASSLATKVEICVDHCTFTQQFDNAPVSFPINIRLHNISSEALSLCFKAGDEWINELSSNWKQVMKTDKDQEEAEVQDAGLSPLANWSWSGQTERNIPLLKSLESVVIRSEIICFSPGSFCVVDYCCKWKSCTNSMITGVAPGKPLYLTVTDAPKHPRKSATSGESPDVTQT